jgi:mannosyl-3-phosphoglycerate phosphatase
MATPLLVFTDLDGTLLTDGRLTESARGAIDALRVRSIPVVPLTSKTEGELRVWLGTLDSGGVGAFENGAGLVTPSGREILPGAVPVGELRELLDGARRRLGLAISTFEELPDATLTAVTRLEGDELSRARTRAFDLPFLASDADVAALGEALAGMPRVRLVAGGAFWHLLGRHDKADALRHVMRSPGAGGRTVGLGDAPGDISFLKAADVPVIVPGPFGPHPLVREALPRARVAPASGGDGWALAIRAILDEIGGGA